MKPTLALILVSGLLACGPVGPASETPTVQAITPGALYPLAEGNVWNYDVHVAGEAQPRLGNTRVVSQTGNRYEISTNRVEPEAYELRGEGIYRVANDSWLLRAPIEVGRSWQSGLGRTTRVVSVNVGTETPAGDFVGCVELEEATEESSASLSAIYCPGVGLVRLETAMQGPLGGQSAGQIVELRGCALAAPAAAPCVTLE